MEKRIWWARHSTGHTFRWDVEYRSISKPAFLTYVLLKPWDRCRRTLAIEAGRSHEVREWLTPDEYDAVNRLETLMVEKMAHPGVGRTGAAKSLAVDLFLEKLKLPNVEVAVHKFGAVPIYIIPGANVSIEVLGQQRECQIGVFVSGGGSANRLDESSARRLGPVNALELIRSLSIRPDLTFIRYMEDVGEYADDIRTKRNWPGLFRYGRKIEEILASSVNSKIKTVLDYANPDTKPTSNEVRVAVRREARRCLEDNRALLWQYSAARILYLFILNQLYRAVGMKDKCDEYDQRYRNIGQCFSFSAEERDHIYDTDSEMGQLHAVWETWHSADPVGDLTHLKTESSNSAGWLNRLIDFACFAARINHLGAEAATTKVFFSSRLSSRMRAIRREAGAILEERGGERAHLLYVEDERPGFPFAAELAPRIWLCDAVLAIFSPRTEMAGIDRDWVSHEVTSAKRFSLTCLLVRDESVDRNEVARRLAKEGLDSADQLVLGENIPELPNSVLQCARFLEPHLLAVVTEAAKRKCETLLLHFLRNFFTDRQTRLIAAIHLAGLEPLNPSFANAEPSEEGWIEYSEIERKLRIEPIRLVADLNSITKRERSLSFDSRGIEVSPVSIERKQRRCRGNLLAALEVMRPELAGYPEGDLQLRIHLLQIMKRLVS